MVDAYINAIACAVPPHDVHAKFLDYAPRLLADERNRKLLARMAGRAEIEHRYSVLSPDPDPDLLDRDGFYQAGHFPTTRERMAHYERHALPLAVEALDRLDFAAHAARVTHLIVVSCTGFAAPGLDLQLVKHYGLNDSLERTLIGFMGCYAAMNALKLARHIVRSQPHALVAIVNAELCTLHLQDRDDLEEVLSFLLFADGVTATLVSSTPTGIALEGFSAGIAPGTDTHITWRIGQSGFDMNLSGRVPGAIAEHLPAMLPRLADGDPDEVALWAIHPGGRSVLDAVETAARIGSNALSFSRSVLRRFGNMSSATVLFVLADMLNAGASGKGLGLAFGPGMTVEAMRFRL
jgi:predicted naringenin-chalcone synthase